MKLLDTSGGNTKLRKTTTGEQGKARVAGLSLYPNDLICPMRHKAGCADACLRSAGRGRMSNVVSGRVRKTDWYHADRPAFLTQLNSELNNFALTCQRSGVLPIVRLNVISDILYEKLGVPQLHPEINFYDYTKISSRLVRPLPDNYSLIFSYSSKREYAPHVAQALESDCPIAVVFNGPMPKTFLGREVINGDKSDLHNLRQRASVAVRWGGIDSNAVVVGLKAKGDAKHDTSGFVVHTISI